jgi:HSP20 family protein
MVERVFGAAGVDLAPYPSVDVREEKTRYVLEAELPGYDREDVDIQVKDGMLTLSSAGKDGEEADASSARSRRRAFSRQFALPKDVNAAEIEAVFVNGLLVVNLHKVPEATPRKIEVQVG